MVRRMHTLAIRPVVRGTGWLWRGASYTPVISGVYVAIAKIPADVGTGGTGQELGVPGFRVHRASEQSGHRVV